MLSRLDGDENSSDDIKVLTPQIQFEKGVKTSHCKLSIINDEVFEDIETFKLELSSPDRALLGSKTTTTITMTDAEDGKTLDSLL